MNMREIVYRLLNMGEVVHTTLNPAMPGSVRIHLVPPRFSFKATPSIIVLNGQDVIPINTSWAILLQCFIDQVNVFEGREVSEEDLRSIVNSTVLRVKKVYTKVSAKILKEDLWKIVNTLTDIACHIEPTEEIGYMTMGEYTPFMTAPHRMDLMISAMTKNGNWHCNQKCLHCYAAGQVQGEVKEMETDEWKTVIAKCKKIGIPQVTFTGGEPTMRDDLVELIDYAKWFVTRLNTNAVKLTKELCEKLYEASLDSVQITLYSANEEEHNFLVGAQNFKYTVEGIKNAVAAGLNVSINTPLCENNKNYVETIKFVYSLGVECVSCSGLIVTGNACSQESRATQLEPDELFEILSKATEYCAKERIEISFTSPGWISEERLTFLNLAIPSCGAGLSNMAITPNGGVVPCQSWLSDDVLGSILTDDWKKIWKSNKCVEIRQYASEMKYTCPLKN